MNKLDRRSFLHNLTASPARPSLWCRHSPLVAAQQRPAVASRVPGANGDIRFAVVGFNGRGGRPHRAACGKSRARAWSPCAMWTAMSWTRRSRSSVTGRASRELHRHPQAAREQGHRRRHHRHAQPLARAGRHLGHAGRQGRLCGKAGLAQRLGRPPDGRRRPASTTASCRPARSAAPAAASARPSPGCAPATSARSCVARGLCYKRRASIGKVDGPQPIPADIDYDLWCGPAPKVPLMRKKLHYDWHWVWNTGNGDLGNQGIHQMDMARWVLGETALSPRVLSVGGRLGYVDDGDTPNTQIVFHDYPDAPLSSKCAACPPSADCQEHGQVPRREHRHRRRLRRRPHDRVQLHRRDRLRQGRQGNQEVQGQLEATSPTSSRPCAAASTSDLNADILEGHLSSALCHTGNISYRLGKTADRPRKSARPSKRTKDLAEALGRMEAASRPPTMWTSRRPRPRWARSSRWTRKTERFIGNRKANKLLTRDYRKPFVVPAKV